jgi:hypothetical protein
LRIRIEHATEADDAGYLRFARASFGASAYQASYRYLAWLYDHGPYSRGRGRDFWVARDEAGMIRGCIHQLRLPWSANGAEVIVPALHNTMMEPAHRGVAGGMLILQAMKGEGHVFVPGAEGAVAATLRRLRFVPVATQVRRRLLRPVAALGAMLAERAGWQTAPVRVRETALRAVGAIVPRSAEELAGLVALANRGGSGEFRPHWTVEAMGWRFFHAEGPLSALWIEGDLASPRAFAIVSIGRRRGVVLARVLCSAAVEPEWHTRVLQQAAQGACALGAQAIQFTSGGDPAPDLPGWRAVSGAPQTLIYHRKPATGPDRFCAGAGDYGLEALLTER